MQSSRSHVAMKFLTSLDGALEEYAQGGYSSGNNVYAESDSSSEIQPEAPEKFDQFKEYFKKQSKDIMK